MKFFFHILLLLTCFTTSTTFSAPNISIPSHSNASQKSEQLIYLESSKIGISNFTRSLIDHQQNTPFLQNTLSLSSYLKAENSCSIDFQKTASQNQVKVAQFSQKEKLSLLENRTRVMSFNVVSGAGNTLFSKSTIAGINGFSDNIATVLSQRGLSLNDFKLLQQKRYDLMTFAERAHIDAIRNSIPNPNSNTIIQKVIPLNKIDDYIVKGYKPRGFVSTAADSKHLNTYDEIYDGMRLDYKIDDIGTQAFNSSDNGCYVIRFKATNANQATPAVNLTNPDPFPYTNNGFTSGMNNKLGVPEWKMPDAEIIEGVIFRKNLDGSEIEYAIWDATLNKFILK